MVADNVKLYTKNVNDKEYIWESNSDKTYTITENDSPILNRGTQIHLHIKEDQKEFLDINTLKETIKRYTQFINFPIELLETKEVEEEVEEEEVCEKCDDKPNEEVNEQSEKKEETESNKENDEPEIEELDENEEDNEEKEEKTKKTIKKMVKEWNIINDQKPIWCKKPEEVSDEEYSEFYKSITSDYSKPLAHKHFYAEGQLEFNCLLYIPERAPFNIFEQENKKNNIKLYVKKIFIMDDCEDLIPEWLKFVKGVVDSEDIPLNVSREILQQNKILKKISKVVVKKCVLYFSSS
jgi:molecular chaperone HtpG